MSTKRGNFSRTRPQKYKNRTVFKNDLHDTTPQMKMLNSLQVCGVCEHCKSVIEWKIKYRKYNRLSKPKTCIRCHNRNITKAYHVVCRDCAKKEKICSKCLKSADQVSIEPPAPTEVEQIQLKVEMDRLIKALPERKKRTFLRYMKKGKNSEDPTAEGNTDLVDDGDKDDSEACRKEKIIIPHTREDLLKKIEQLKLGGDDDGGDDLDSGDSDCENGSDDECSS